MFFFLSGWIWGWCIEFPQPCGVNTVSASLKALWTVFCFNVSTLTANWIVPGVSIAAPICVRMEKWPVPSVFLLKWNYRSAVCTSEGPHAQNNSFDALIRDNGPSKVLFIRPRSLWRVWLLQSVPLSSWVPPSPLLRLSRHLLFKSLHNSSSARQYPLLCSFFIWCKLARALNVHSWKSKRKEMAAGRSGGYNSMLISSVLPVMWCHVTYWV